MGDPGQAALSYPDATMDPSIAQADLIYQIQDGKHRIVSRTPYSDSTFQAPSWVPPKAASGSQSLRVVRH